MLCSSSALKVLYCETYPLLELADNDPQTVLLPLLAKAKDWSYEDEYRRIAQEESAALNRDCLITKNNLLKLAGRRSHFDHYWLRGPAIDPRGRCSNCEELWLPN